MRHYCVRPIKGADEEYWVLAASDNEAKRLVALNIPRVSGDETNLECAANSIPKFAPPWGIIVTSGGQTFTVVKT